MKGSVQRSFIQPLAEFCLSQDLSPGPREPKSGAITARPCGCFIYLKYLDSQVSIKCLLVLTPWVYQYN